MAPNENGKQRHGSLASGLPQRIADSDPAVKEKIRQKVKSDIFVNPEPLKPMLFFNMSIFSFLLPEHWGFQPADFMNSLYMSLLDLNIMKAFETKGIINWNNTFTKLYPLKTTGDGNCLLHAISLFLWGIEDLDLQMRRVLYQDLFKDNGVKKYKQRWQLRRTAFDETLPSGGLRYDTMNWDDEWKLVIRNSSPEPNPEGQHMLPFHSLEEIHIFIMANILRRPIIVLADTMFRDHRGQSLQPQNVTGIYLPVLSKSKDCCTLPIILGYHGNHFVPLVGKKLLPDEHLEMALPLCTKDIEAFPVHFLLPDEEATKFSLLESYLSQKALPQSGIADTMVGIQVTILGDKQFNESVNIMETYFRLAEKNYRTGSMFTPQKKVETRTESGKAGVKICCMCNKSPADGENDVCKECLVTTCTSFHPSASAPPVSMPIDRFNDMTLEENGGKDPHESVYRGQPLLPSASNFDNNAQQCYSICVDKPCKTPGCQFYCSSKLPGDYCHTCGFNAPMGQQHNPMGQQHSPMGQQHSSIEKCRTTGCSNLANFDRQGLCDLCSETQQYKKPSRPQVVGYDLPSPPLPTASGFPSSYKERSNAPIDPSGLDSLQILQSSTGTKKCLERTCKLTGQEAFQGFCQRCYHKNVDIKKRVESVPQQRILTSTLKQGSMVPMYSAVSSVEVCRTKNCNLFGTKEQNGYCTKCLGDVLMKESNKCKNHWCGGQTFHDGYCKECFEHTPRLGGENLSSNVTCGQAISLPNLCITNGCQGVIVTLGDGKHCHGCHKEKNDTVQPMMKCVYPKCNEMTPRDQPICINCQDILDANKPKDVVATETPAPTTALKLACSICRNSFAGSDGICNICRPYKKNGGNATNEGTRCKSPGCDMFGTAEHDWLCSKCYSNKPAKRESHSAPIKSCMTKDEPYNPRKCVNGCGGWANVQVLNGLCNDCYQLYKTDRPGKGSQTPGKVSQSARIVNDPQGYQAEPRNRNRTDGKCFNPKCTNRGNPKSHGFCNSCSKKLEV
ncbi:tumor necrosis factor alpha-induced protein 3-like [Antedon mediterranea]|uniref:tumor necrosis factor alpha-induced protein 3-like n=1 Tax=Antedon mediterranea TaxID=105859 RepID=UPI003AF98D19